MYLCVHIFAMNMKKTIAYILLVMMLAGSLRAQIPGSFTYEGLDRTYTVYLPASYTAGDQLPLLFSLHGLTQTGNIMMQFTDFNTYADQYNFIVVYPDGINNSWNVGFSGGSTANDVGYLSALIDTLHAQYGIDLNRVYSTGYSNGGFMSYRLACELTGRFAAIAPVAGTMTDGAWGSCQPSRDIPVMHIHGTNDFVVFYNGGFGNKSVAQVLELWRGFSNCPANAVIIDLPDLVAEGSTVQTHTWAPCDDSVEVVHYKVINGGHTWPGSIGTTGVGNTNRDIIASDEIWKFVSRFSLNLPTGVHEVVQTNISCYPNPSENGSVSIRCSHLTGPAILTVFSSRGNAIYTSAIPQNTGMHVTGLTGISAGLYILKVQDEKGCYTEKFIVR
jgi:polyhydroxybutyrate depolymerase